MCAIAQRVDVAPPTYRPLVVVLAAACAGVVIDRLAPLSFLAWGGAALMAWMAWLAAWRHDRQRIAAPVLLLSVACTAAAWHHCRWSLFADDDVALFASEISEPIALEARALRSPRRIPPPPFDPLRTVSTPERSRLDVAALALRDGERWRPVSGKLTLFADGYLTQVRAGDTLRVFGQLSAMRQPANPGEFDRASYARADRRLCGVSTDFLECITVVSPGSAWSWAGAIDALRGGGDSLLWRNLHPQRSGLASAMFLGSREELEPERSEAFMETGTIHLLVISGLNVGILAGCLFVATRAALVPDRAALAVVALACVAYALATDAQPPVIRATVMVLVGCVAMMLGRRALGFNTIAAAGLVVLAINPAELFRPGTQLSFLSVAVLAWAGERASRRRPLDPLDRLVARTRPWPERIARRAARDFWRAVFVSAAIWLVICPLIMARFHLVSPVAVVLGPLLALPVTLAMGSGFGILVAGWIPGAAGTLGWVCDASLAIMDNCVLWARSWPGNHFWVAGPSNWWLVGFYGALGVLVLVPRVALPRRWCIAVLAAWTAAGLASSWIGRGAADSLECTFLSVGHGSAVVVQLPGGQTLLYDAGRLGSPGAAASAVSGYLWSRGITHIDALVISHADADHYNAVPELLNQFSVGAIYVSPLMFERPARGLDALRAAINRAGLQFAEVWTGDRLRALGGARIEVLHPPREGVLGSDNANSIVLSVEYQSRRVLLCGDLEGRGLQEVLAEPAMPCDVLLAPHHGSAASDPPGLAAWCSPGVAIVSGGPRDLADVTAAAYRVQGSRVLHTATTGAVRMSIDAVGGLAIDCWRQRHE